MLTDALRAIVNNLFKEIFMEKEKKKEKEAINILIVFSISHKSSIKTFLF